MFLLYNLLLTLLAPAWVPWMLFRTWRRKEPVNWRERQGDYDIPKRGDRRRIWFHAVSVGEVLAALPVLRAVRQRLPNYEVVLTVTTSSGHATALDRAEGLYDYLLYFPIDVARFQLRAMQRVRPDVVAIMETELWMNFLWSAKTFDAQTLLMNGRISDRNFRRSRHLAFFYRFLLKGVDRCLMQSNEDADRIRSLGAKSVDVLGNCKFDEAVEATNANPARWRKELGIPPDRPVVVVGSIRAEEFQFLAVAIAQLPTAYWIVAPRHLEKVPDLLRHLNHTLEEFQGKPPTIGLRSQRTTGELLVLDTYGELASVYLLGDVVIVGGGFADLGGQNILQPLALGKPVLFGPHMQNFREVAALAERAGAARMCPGLTPDESMSAQRLAEATHALLEDPAARQRMGEAARALVREHIGASDRYAEEIVQAAARAYDATGPRPRPPFP